MRAKQMIFAATTEDIAYSVLAAVAALLTAVAVGFRKVIGAWFTRWERRVLRRQYTDSFKTYVAYYEICETINKLEFVDRVIVWVGKNNGGMPDPKTDYTIVCRHGWATRTLVDTDKYKFPISIDSHHIKTLIEMMEKKFVVVTTADLPDDATMKNYYMIDGIHTSVLGYVGINSDENSLIYISISNSTRPFTRNELAILQIHLGNLRSVFRSEDATSWY